MKNAYNMDLLCQMETLDKILQCNKTIYRVLERAELLGLENYYIGAGCISQTVWNYLSGNDLLYGINDVDIVYFDSSHLDYESEEEVIAKAKMLFSDLDLEVDVKNEARVHLWYKDHFGYEIDPYKSLEDAINSWPTTATALGVRIENQKLQVFAPFGLNDLFGKIIRPNKGAVTKEVYENKANKWTSKWPDLIVIPWE